MSEKKRELTKAEKKEKLHALMKAKKEGQEGQKEAQKNITAPKKADKSTEATKVKSFWQAKKTKENKSNPQTQTVTKTSSVHIRQFGYVRALGLALVLIYHFYPKILPGGFIGVDVFFVFSGYLITALALEEYRLNKSFSLAKFGERRFFRIFPTVAFAMLIILPLTLFGNADLRYNLTQQAFSGLGFVSNLYEASTGISYANSAAPHIFVHLWSLALEVQFYLVWGVIIYLLAKYVKSGVKGLVFLSSTVVFLISGLAMFIGAFGTTDYSQLYYSPISHVFPFFIGAMLASLGGINTAPMIKKLSRKWTTKQLIFFASLAAAVLLILGMTLQFGAKFTYLLGFGLAVFAAVALVLFLRLLHEKTEKEEPKAIKFIADVSYGVYIFHWPFLIIFLNLKVPHLLALLLTILLSFGLSAVMFYRIDPILKGKIKLSTNLNLVALALALFLVIPSVVAIAKNSNQTSLSETLWRGSNQQASQQLAFDEKALRTGTAGKDTLVIGDSVTVGVTLPIQGGQTIQEAIPTVYSDAEESRTIEAAISRVKTDLTMLPADATIIFALGTNSVNPGVEIKLITQFIKDYSAEHKIVFVTPANWGAGGPFNSDAIADFELTLQGTNKNVKIADWRGLSKGHPDWFDVDGIHVADRLEGRTAWIDLVKRTLAQ